MVSNSYLDVEFISQSVLAKDRGTVDNSCFKMFFISFFLPAVEVCLVLTVVLYKVSKSLGVIPCQMVEEWYCFIHRSLLHGVLD